MNELDIIERVRRDLSGAARTAVERAIQNVRDSQSERYLLALREAFGAMDGTITPLLNHSMEKIKIGLETAARSTPDDAMLAMLGPFELTEEIKRNNLWLKAQTTRRQDAEDALKAAFVTLGKVGARILLSLLVAV